MTEALQQEIRTLKSLFESERDPQGRAFAPLADAYRRAGEIQSAVRVLSEGLARHPNFVPGHVVAAQLYVEQGLAEEAAIAARQALKLDAENVNALHSLLRVLDESAGEEADEIRARLETLDPNFEEGDRVAAPTTTSTGASGGRTAAVVEEDWDREADSLDLKTVEHEEAPPALRDTAAVGSLPFDLGAGDADAPVPGEALIDLDSLSVGIPEVEVDVTDASSGLAPVREEELPTEEPLVDLADLPAVGSEVAEEISTSFVQSAAEAVPDLADLGPTAYDEPVMELAELAPEAEDEPVMELAELAPEVEDEPVMELAELAPEVEDEPVMELAELAPEAEDEPVVELAELAPEVEDEPVMELAELAPEVEDEPVMELAELAPEAEDEPVVELAELAPEVEDEPVMELAELAPEAEDEPVMELAELAPEVEDEPVMELAELAPEVEDEPVMELAELAPEVEDEPVMELAELAPEVEDETAAELQDLLPGTGEGSVDDRPTMEGSHPASIDVVGPEGPVEAGVIRDASIETDAHDGEEGLSPDDALTMVDLVALTGEPEEREEAPEPSPVEQAVGPEAAHDEVDEVDARVESTFAADQPEEGEGIGEADEYTLEPIQTRTLAELYLEQGILDQAIEVYRHLHELNPGDEDIARRIAELESVGGPRQAGQRPPTADQDEELEALARELHEHGEEAHQGGVSPYGLEGGVDDTTAEDEGADPGPTIGDYFEGLLGWGSEGRS